VPGAPRKAVACSVNAVGGEDCDLGKTSLPRLIYGPAFGVSCEYPRLAMGRSVLSTLFTTGAGTPIWRSGSVSGSCCVGTI